MLLNGHIHILPAGVVVGFVGVVVLVIRPAG
jgi:hypothetical protein